MILNEEVLHHRIGENPNRSTCQNLDKPVRQGLDEIMKSQLLDSDLDQILDVALTACDGASQILLNHFGHLRSVGEKYQAGLVTEADRNSETFIVETIRKSFSDHEILGEEFGRSVGVKSTNHDQKSVMWFIDPLDGTTNYVHQLPFFCISIGVQIDGRPVVGVVDAPKMGLRFHAIRGRGAFLNGESIRVSEKEQLNDALCATGFSKDDPGLALQMQFFMEMLGKSRGIRRVGAAALDLCFVAQGLFDLYWERNLSPWDTAAGALIAEEAGGSVTDMHGGAFDPMKKSIVCSNRRLHSQALRIFKTVFEKNQ